MRNFLYFLGSAVYGAAAAFVTFIFFRWFYGFTLRLMERLVGSPAIYILVLLVAVFILYIVLVYASTVLAFPLKLMRNETTVVKYLPSLLMLAAGFLAGRLPWLAGPFDLYRISFGIAFDFIVCNVVFGVILFTWKKTDGKSADTSAGRANRR